MDWKQIIKDNGLTITSLADKMLVSRPTIYAWFEHKAIPNAKEVVKLSRYLNVAIGKLMTYFNKEE